MAHEITLEEKAYEGLLNEKLETLSEAACSIFEEATTQAYKVCLLRNYAYQPEEYDLAEERMRLPAKLLTRRGNETLSEIVRAGFLAALSLHPGDMTRVWHKVEVGDYHWYYRMSSTTINEHLWKKVPEPIWQDA